jgi:hypothetical protein
MGTDMVCCDSDAGGLFHKKCVQYDELEEENEANWFCVACDTLIEDGYESLESIEERPISGNNVYALKLAITEALDEVPHLLFVASKVARSLSDWCMRATGTMHTISTGENIRNRRRKNKIFFVFREKKSFAIFRS